jgi:glycosyltransferase involved in cell wall biosynthesis
MWTGFRPVAEGPARAVRHGLAPWAGRRQDAGVRVLQLVAADRWTGAAATALQLAEALRGAGVDCHFAYRPGRGLEQRLNGFEWCHPVLRKERSLAEGRAALRRVRELCAGFDVLHVHLPHDHVLVRLALRGSATPVFRSIHHAGHLRRDPYHRWLFRGLAGVGLANSAMIAACRRFGSLREAKCAVLPVALEERFLRQHPAAPGRETLGIPADAVVVGTIGKLVRDRGHDLFIRALAAAPGLHGVVVGKGPYVPKLEKLARALNVADRLTFAGYVEEGLEQVYTAMDLFVFPAAGSDPAHRAIAEVSACGVPTLAADLPGVRDLVDPGESGELYPATDAAALAVLLGVWGVDAALRARAGAAARRRAHERWTSAALAATALRLYEQRV